MLPYVASALGLIGVFMAWRTNKRHHDLNEQIERMNSRIYSLRREVQVAQEQAEQEQAQMQYEIMNLQGELKIKPSMRIGEIIAMHPQAQQLLAGFHIGGCSNCAVDDNQRLDEAVTGNERELQPILVALNNLVSQNGVSVEQLKTPNVTLQI